MTDRTGPRVSGVEMRTGRRKPRTLYLMTGGGDRELDVLVGLVDTVDLAEEICRRWNVARKVFGEDK